MYFFFAILCRNVLQNTEVAGTVIDTHNDSPYSVGDRIMSLVNGGVTASMSLSLLIR